MRFSLVVLLACGCMARHARTARTAGEMTAGGAIIGMLGTIVAAEAFPGARSELFTAGLVLVPVTLLGAGVYIAADSMIWPDDETAVSERSRRWDAAMALAKQAKHAARAGDCAEVQSIEPRVRELSNDVYLRFLRDPVIRPCRVPREE